jgi:hypothetical protein
MIAAIHLSPLVSLPGGLLIAAWLAWYWVRLGGTDVPAARRHRRRATIVLLYAALALLVAGLSFIDPRVHQAAYVTVWSITLLMMLIIFIAACFDAVLTVRLDRYELEIQEAIRRVRDAAEHDAAGQAQTDDRAGAAPRPREDEHP